MRLRRVYIIIAVVSVVLAAVTLCFNEYRYSCAGCGSLREVREYSLLRIQMSHREMMHVTQRSLLGHTHTWWQYSSYSEWGPWGLFGKSVADQPSQYRPPETGPGESERDAASGNR